MYRNQQQSFSKAHVTAQARLLFLQTETMSIYLEINRLKSPS
jgi:hypothetical protein